MAEKATPILAVSLTEDLSVYPRNRIDDTHARELANAIRAGAVLPPIVIDAASKRIVDGFHRRRAAIMVDGDTALVSCIQRRYDSEAALYADAVLLNSAHGRKLDNHDKTRIILRARELGIDDESIAKLLVIEPSKVEQISLRIVISDAGDSVPLKRGLEHMQGEILNTAQISTLRSVRSAESGRLALELTRLLDNGMVDLEDDHIVLRLTQLQDSLGRALSSVPVPA